jgi:hypothetical protein
MTRADGTRGGVIADRAVQRYVSDIVEILF